MTNNDPQVKLFAALVKVQDALNNPNKDQQGYGYKYTDLSTIIEQVKPVLKEHGLAVIQMPINNEQGRVGVKTMLVHEEGGSISEDYYPTPLNIPQNKEGKKSMNEAQADGAGITYARRYALSAFLNIASEEDTDAQSPRNNKPKTNTQKRTAPKQYTPSPTSASPKQITYIWTLVDEAGLDRDEFQKGVYLKNQIDSMKKLTATQASKIIDALNHKIEEKSETPDYGADYEAAKEIFNN